MSKRHCLCGDEKDSECKEWVYRDEREPKVANKHIQYSKGSDLREKGCVQKDSTDDMVSCLSFKEAVNICQGKEGMGHPR